MLIDNDWVKKKTRPDWKPDFKTWLSHQAASEEVSFYEISRRLLAIEPWQEDVHENWLLYLLTAVFGYETQIGKAQTLRPWLKSIKEMMHPVAHISPELGYRYIEKCHSVRDLESEDKLKRWAKLYERDSELIFHGESEIKRYGRQWEAMAFSYAMDAVGFEKSFWGDLAAGKAALAIAHAGACQKVEGIPTVMMVRDYVKEVIIPELTMRLGELVP